MQGILHAIVQNTNISVVNNETMVLNGFSFLFLYSHISTNANIQDYTTGSMDIHSNPVAITNN